MSVDLSGSGGRTTLPLERQTPPDYTLPGAGSGGDQTTASLPAGTPTLPGNVAATAPLPYQTFGGIAQIAPTYVDPANAQAYYQQYAQMQQQALDPTFQQQQRELQSQLAARGISNSGAAGYLEGNLLGQQGATLAGQEAPLLAQAFGYNQQADQANAQYGNAASLYNANAYQGAVGQNFDAYNSYLNELLGLGASNTGALQAAYLNSYGPNTGVTGAYNNALAGTQNIFGSVYGAQMNQNNQNMTNLGEGLAMAFG